jgi:poly [ADP-ribose] polymerase
LERKRREKLRKGYKDSVVFDNHVETAIRKENRKELSRIAAEQIGGAAEDSTTSRLIDYLAEVNIHHITHSTSIKYNPATATFSTPLGVLTPDAISRARDLLNEVKRLNSLKRRRKADRASRVRDYFQLVPKDFGMRVPPSEELLAAEDQIEAEVSILDALESALATVEPQTDHSKLFQCRLIKVPHTTPEGKALFRDVRGLYDKTRNSGHHPATTHLQMTRLYEVEVEAMKIRFEQGAKRIGNVRNDLWHGTKASNLLSILKNGLVIPPSNAAHCTGRMFGNGIYTSLQSTKALNYATDFWNRSGKANQRTFMFPCDVALGKTYEPHSYGGQFPAKGTNSTWVNPRSGGVLNHECIVYDTSQINLKYLAEFGAR